MTVIHVSLAKGCFLLTLFSLSLVIVNHLETLLEALTYCLLFKRSLLQGMLLREEEVPCFV